MLHITNCILVAGVYMWALCLVAGRRSSFPHNQKLPNEVRKVVVEEIRFGVCYGDATRNSSAQNDATLSRDRLFTLDLAHSESKSVGSTIGSHRLRSAEKIRTEVAIDRASYSDHKGAIRKHSSRTENENENSREREGRDIHKRFAVSYHCPKDEDRHATPIKRGYKTRADPNIAEDASGLFGDAEGGPSAKIVGGDDAEINSWPFLASVQYLGLDLEWHHFCGGSLIQAHWLVTAAHCVMHIEDYYIRVVLGDFQLSKFSHREQIINPERIFRHKYFNESSYHYDIAMIKLQADARMSKYVSTVEVATEAEVSMLDQSDTCYIAGWGNIVGTTTELFLSDDLQQTRMWVMAHAQCQNWISSDIIASEICVSSDEASACTGDSGGPLVCHANGEWLLVGSASFVVSATCAAGSPNVYTRASDYVFWMTQVIQQYDPELA